MSAPLWVVGLGTVPYGEADALQRSVRDARQEGRVPDVLLLLEHPPVYTKGRRSTAEELPMGEDWYRMQGIEIAEADRGGRVTYHGPGQLVAYPVVDLAPYGDDVHAYVRRLERVILDSLAEHGVPSQIFDGLTGVWTEGAPPIPEGHPGPQGTPVGAVLGDSTGGEARKIGSIGVHVNRGVTTHGLAVNVSNDLQPFEWIVPCGVEHVRMTSLTREHGSEQSVDAFAATIAERFAAVYERDPVEIGPERLAEELAAQPASPGPA